VREDVEGWKEDGGEEEGESRMRGYVRKDWKKEV